MSVSLSTPICKADKKAKKRPMLSGIGIRIDPFDTFTTGGNPTECVADLDKQSKMINFVPILTTS
jgi:hypothetical protein